jgi:undecaprenyl-diphosphatase
VSSPEVATGPAEPSVDVRPRLLAGAAAIVASAVPILVLALLVRDTADPVARFDQRVDVQLTGFALRHDTVRRMAEIGGYVLHPWLFRLSVLAVAFWLLRRGARSAAIWAAGTMVVASALGALLKLVVQRARPVLDEPVAAASGYSFPSGHALNAALGVSVLLVILWRPLGRRGYRAAALALGVLLVVAAMVDRLVLGVHFPTDVIAGVLIGVLVVASSWVAFGPVLRERARRGADEASAE